MISTSVAVSTVRYSSKLSWTSMVGTAVCGKRVHSGVPSHTVSPAETRMSDIIPARGALMVSLL
jgi:hypothetical protein